MSARPGTLHVLAAAVRERRISATALVTASIERLERAGPLNVTAETFYDSALREATRIDDERITQGRLLGVPTLVKDLDDLRGHPTRKGSLALRDAAPATANGVVPGRLLAEGAVVLGKSTLPEFAIEGYTANLLTGVTRNPWNLDYSPGGSSGGSAAAVAAGLVGVATATDGGGSIRIPASLCGLVGLKPTNGVIGRWPAPDWIDYSTDGPFATSCDDLRLLLDVMRGRIAGDPTSPPNALTSHWARHDDRPVSLFAAERTSPLGPLSPAVSSLLRSGVEAIEDRLGTKATWIEADGFFADGDPDLDWFTVTTAEHVASLGRAWVIEHMDEFHVATREFLTTGLGVTVDEYLGARRRRYVYVRRIDELLEDNGLLVTPTVAAPGWLADGRMSADTDVRGLTPDVYSTAVQNVTGNPAISIPFGHLPSGLPFGLQITAPHYHDYRLVDVATLMESAYPWAVTAPGFERLDAVLDLA
ncbi:MAG: amidase [Acidobacteria bacterium]|nr:amidase [Acidobacteriota bacterium]